MAQSQLDSSDSSRRGDPKASSQPSVTSAEGGGETTSVSSQPLAALLKDEESLAKPMDEVISFYKRPGETPLQALDRLRVEQPRLKDTKLSYAGRLDPLAEGELLVLVGEANKRRAQYLKLDKTYIVDILFGVSTDTHDVLGLITNTSEKTPTQSEIESALKTFTGTFSQPFPLYSSKPHEGIPLHEHARSGRLVEESARPKKDVTIYDIHVLDFYTLPLKDFSSLVKQKVNSVTSPTFRQSQILAAWDQYFATQPADRTYPVISIKVHCSSGTYMRTLADNIGKKLGGGSIAVRIVRCAAATIYDKP